MASPLTEAHIDAQARLRALIARAVGQAWTNLGSWDEQDVEPFLSAAVPVVLAGQRQSVNLTNAYVARFIGRTPWALDISGLVGAGVRNGAEPRVVYRRPFVTVWTALGNGEEWASAVESGRNRAMDAAATDMQLTMRATLRAVAQA